MPKILVVDDERPIVEAISYNLKREGYQISTAGDAEECLNLARNDPPDLVILDIMLPSGSGLEVCRQLRLEHGSIPVLFLTARAEESDRIKGFDVGADDYVVKPFSMKELVARVRAILRRRLALLTSATATKPADSVDSDAPIRPTETTLTIDNLVIDRARREVRRSGAKVELSRKEFDLLATLAANRGKVYDRQTLLSRVWGEDAYVDDRTVDVHIRWLREKIEHDPARPEKLLTVRGIGYKFSG